MKVFYIPEGKYVHYETLSCQNIVNDGVLEVEDALHACNITGKGVLRAGTISARNVVAMDVECATLISETLTAERVCAVEIKLSVSAIVSCHLEAEYVEVPALTVAKHSVNMLKAGDVVNLPEKKRGIVGTLLAGFFRRIWLSLTRPFLTEDVPLDAPYVQVEEMRSGVVSNPKGLPEENMQKTQFQEDKQAVNLEDDFEFKRLKAMYQLLKASGYALRIVPCEGCTSATSQTNSRQDLFHSQAA